ncbi:isopenicillin N synthase family dioxygenase [Parvibaculum sp.]|jgi:isopenicillin N synthase-like dioxygenase|uniref:isopenicillin N synthase family dioxygenase n=3 Tax=Parvibaculum sp. TaxID=2024848 RepID=UPI002FD8F983
MSEIEAKGTAFTSIPIIDIAPLFSDDEAGKRKVAAEMAEAAANVGFLYVKGHNIPREMIDRLEARAAEFFALPEERKMAHYIGKSRAHRGYVPTGEEGFYDGTNPAKMDKKEAFDLSVELPEDDPDHVTGYRMLGPNQWPDELPEMRRDVYAYYEAAMALGRTLFGGFARALGLPENHFERWLTKPPSQLRLVHYPSDPARAVAEWGISAHTDYECFTILHVTAPGLQVMNAKGDWIEAPPVEGAFVINIGDMLEALTNGRFIATPHRVRNVPDERFSFPLFCALDYDTLIEPLPQFVDGEKRYPPYVAGGHLVTQTMRTFRYLKELVADGKLELPESEDHATAFGRRESEPA